MVFESHVRPILLVVHALGLHDGMDLVQGGEPVDIEAFIAQRSVERLDEAVVRRLAGPAEVDLGVVAVSPQVELLSGKFTAIVDEQTFWRGPLCDETRECRRYMLPRKLRPATMANASRL